MTYRMIADMRPNKREISAHVLASILLDLPNKPLLIDGLGMDLKLVELGINDENIVLEIQSTIKTEAISPAVRFDTAYEQNCVVISEPDKDGNFDGVDSEGVQCTFCVRMVTKTY